MYCVVMYCIVLYCIVLYCIVLYSIVLYCIVWYDIILYFIISYHIILYLATQLPAKRKVTAWLLESRSRDPAETERSTPSPLACVENNLILSTKNGNTATCCLCSSNIPLSNMSKHNKSFKISTAVLHAAVTSDTVSMFSWSLGSAFSELKLYTWKDNVSLMFYGMIWSNTYDIKWYDMRKWRLFFSGCMTRWWCSTYARTYIPCRCFRPRYAVFNGVLNSWDMYLMYDLLESSRAFLKPIDICVVWDKEDNIHKNKTIKICLKCLHIIALLLGLSINVKMIGKKR